MKDLILGMTFKQNAQEEMGFELKMLSVGSHSEHLFLRLVVPFCDAGAFLRGGLAGREVTWHAPVLGHCLQPVCCTGDSHSRVAPPPCILPHGGLKPSQTVTPNKASSPLLPGSAGGLLH